MSYCSPPVSVCLVTYNRAQVLGQTIESVLGQTFEDFELIICDDCSPDATKEVCRGYARLDSRVRYYRNQKNLGMPGNLNESIRRAQGQYIANLHDGDVHRKDMLERWIAMLEKYPSAAFVFNYYAYIDWHGNPVGEIAKYYHTEFIPGKLLLRDMLEKTVSPVRGTVMARRKAYEEVGEFDLHFGIISDVDMWLRLASRYDAAMVPEPLITCRRRQPDHPWNVQGWTAFLPKAEELIYTNLVRNYGEPNCDNREIWAKFYRNYQRKIFRQVCADLYHRRWLDLKQALHFLPTSKIPRVARIGRMLHRAFSSLSHFGQGRSSQN